MIALRGSIDWSIVLVDTSLEDLSEHLSEGKKLFYISRIISTELPNTKINDKTHWEGKEWMKIFF